MKQNNENDEIYDNRYNDTPSFSNELPNINFQNTKKRMSINTK